MKKHKYYGISLCAGLLGFHTLTSCVNTRKELGWWPLPSNKTLTAAALGYLAISSRIMPNLNNNDNPIMFIDGKSMKSLEKNGYSLRSMEDVVNQGLNINAQNENGNTIPLLLLKKVIEEGKSRGFLTSDNKMQINVVQYFLNHGADLYIENDQGENVISLINELTSKFSNLEKFFEDSLQKAKVKNPYGKFFERLSPKARKNNAKYNTPK
ncbi:MAG: RNA polymerase sigma factor region1.1 domain-containing protein [Candidatus Cardinium sp.]|uniref:RNA polymerase sigma factor region1.1 domain-containing protein n=1 Tax=Cardinium endosymbiont of Dermatophagoides farinae TaxID=2597823 RepID=UPI001190F9FC|nr:RNA polymerase sigma factor region1.1 domain-containing protein [Cardinium endosymbiont of Dermatophagoides farinae]TSJ81452.1 hypothetical protein FPG78_05780 [Cardinium endosymbiont of Dermatophagoides farinae]UWW96431.1 MAG: RNA polymerase sigma factor region1.1 domain-containing protein [Candidatus Cardinium sp.]